MEWRTDIHFLMNNDMAGSAYFEGTWNNKLLVALFHFAWLLLPSSKAHTYLDWQV